jgi:hypothetical protein
MTVEAIVLGGLVVVVAAFGFAMAYAGRSPRNGNCRDHGDGGPGVFVRESGSDPGAGGGGGD